jgi:hypothetical protein
MGSRAAPGRDLHVRERVASLSGAPPASEVSLPTRCGILRSPLAARNLTARICSEVGRMDGGRHLPVDRHHARAGFYGFGWLDGGTIPLSRM